MAPPIVVVRNTTVKKKRKQTTQMCVSQTGVVGDWEPKLGTVVSQPLGALGQCQARELA